MRIGILVTFLGRDVGGPQTYERCLIEALAELPGPHEFRIYALEPGATRTSARLPAAVGFHPLRPSLRWASLPFTLPWMLFRHRVGLLHATLLAPPWCPTPLVVTLHDTSPFTRPEYFSGAVGTRLRFLLRHTLRQARHILCISDFVRQSAIRELGIAPERLTVVHHGLGPEFRPAPPAEARHRLATELGLHGRYFLGVGLTPGKNTFRILEAFRDIRPHLGRDHRVVLVGHGRRHRAAAEKAIRRLGLEDAVRCLGAVDSRHLTDLYCGAEALVFPSCFEGFGLPVLEAMACGTPVLTSNVASLPEVAGGAALLVDPLATPAIAEAMLRLATDPRLRDDLRARGLRHAAAFTWTRTARETMAVYGRIASPRASGAT